MRPLSNSEVAKLVGVHPGTLERWLASGGLRWPKLLISGSRIVRLWDPKDVKRARRYKASKYKKRHGRKIAPCRHSQSARVAARSLHRAGVEY